MRDFLIHLVVLAGALWCSDQVISGITLVSWQALALGALVLAIVNAVVRPVLVLLTLPLTVLTLGVFYLLVNGAAFGFSAALVPGFEVRTWTAAVLGALLTSLLAWFVGIFVRRD